MLLLACLPVLAGAALFEHYALTRQRLQLRVDSAAEHGAHAVANGLSSESEARRRLAETSALRDGDRVAVEHPPKAGRFRGWKTAVRVRVRRPWTPPLLPRGLTDQVTLDVAATAVAVPPGPGHPQTAPLRVE